MQFQLHYLRADLDPYNQGKKKKYRKLDCLEAGTTGEDADQADLQQAMGETHLHDAHKDRVKAMGEENDGHSTTLHPSTCTSKRSFLSH